jgi:hypothetical protein
MTRQGAAADKRPEILGAARRTGVQPPRSLIARSMRPVT